MRVKMPSISCFSYRLWGRVPYNFTFIKFEKFIKVILNSRTVVFTNDELASHQRLFQLFTLSMLLTEDTSQVSSIMDKNKIVYGVSTLKHWNKSRIADYYEFVQLDKSNAKNPLNAVEPKRASSDKKMRKFFKLFHIFYEYEMIKDPLIIFEEFFARETYELFDYVDKINTHECRVNILASVLHTHGKDVYDSIKRFM
jgi:hypothetical protein